MYIYIYIYIHVYTYIYMCILVNPDDAKFCCAPFGFDATRCMQLSFVTCNQLPLVSSIPTDFTFDILVPVQ